MSVWEFSEAFQDLSFLSGRLAVPSSPDWEKADLSQAFPV